MELGMTRHLQRTAHIHPVNAASADPFYSWSASFSDGKMFCLNDLSGIGFIYTGDISDLQEIIPAGIRFCLQQLKVSPELVKKYMTSLGSVEYRRVRNSMQSGRLGNFCRRFETCVCCQEEDPMQQHYRFRLHSDCVEDSGKRRSVADLFALGMKKKYRTNKIYYGEHEAARYAARPFPSSRIYPGYQFYARLTYDGYSADACFRYAALTITDWLRERMRDSELPAELCTGNAAMFVQMENTDLRSVSGSEYRVASMPARGAWALWLREPDPKINGRSFITNAAVHILDDHAVELGVRIDVLDRRSDIPEVAYAYRPKFMRLLFMTPGLHFSQSTPLLYKELTVLDTKKSLENFMNLVSNPQDSLPIIVFTHAQEKVPEAKLPLPQVTVPVPGSDFLLPIEMLKGQKAAPITFQKDFVSPDPIKSNARNKLVKVSIPISRPAAQPVRQPELKTFLPFDAAEFASHTYGFGRVFVLQADLFESLRRQLKYSELRQGDILLIEPKIFGGGIRSFKFKSGMSSKAYAALTESILDILRCYSKHKPYTFGTAVFIEGVQSMIRQAELEQIHRQLSAVKTEQEENMLIKLEQAGQRIEELQQDIEELRRQLTSEYQRGTAAEQERSKTLERNLAEVQSQNTDLIEKNQTLTEGYDEVKGIKASLEAIRTTPSLPQNCSEVTEYFRRVFADRLDFTDQGIRTAEKCDIKPAVLWECLYRMATVLCDIHRRNVTDVETEFKELTGWEVSMSEGSQTRSNPKLMALRKDYYDGREISIEPHLKLAKAVKKSGAAFQRIYYCYDGKTRKIIIGWVGGHMENHSSLNFS